VARRYLPGAIEEVIRKVRQSVIPAPEKIVAEAFERLGYNGSSKKREKRRKMSAECKGVQEVQKGESSNFVGHEGG